MNKFRVWNKDEYISFSNAIYWNLVGVEHEDEANELKSFEEGVIIEQWTGLKDKNCVEIYEGDILRIDGPWNIQGEPWYGDEEEKYTYKIGELIIPTYTEAGLAGRGSKCIKKLLEEDVDIYSFTPNERFFRSPITHYKMWNYQMGFVVIGNINENKELLGVKNE